MRVLVTGGAGFIGCNAAARFAADGRHVLVVDNFSRRGSRINAAWLRDTHRVESEEVDIRDPAATERVVGSFGPDVVIHCAGQVAVTTSVHDPRSDFLDNALGTLNVLEACRKHARDAAFLYTSTNKVYGGMRDVKVELQGDRYGYVSLAQGCSETQPLDFHSPYGCSKGAADQYVRAYAQLYGMRTVVFRQSCVYGCRQFGVEDQGWVTWFALCAACGKPITIYGDGKQVRDVLFVDDLVDAFQAAVAGIDRVSGHVFNIGGGPANASSLLEVVGLLEAFFGRRLDVAFRDWRPGDQRVFICDVRKAREMLGWSPTTAMRDGIARLATWVCENRAILDGQ